MKPLQRLFSVNRLMAVMVAIWPPRPQSQGRPVAGLILTLVLLPGVVYLLAEALRKPSTFHIAADTEVMDMVTTDVSATRWYIQQAEAKLGAAGPLEERPIEAFAFSGLVEIGPRSNVRMVRYGNGPLQITLLEEESVEHQSSGDDLVDSHNGNILGEDKSPSRAIPVVTLENLSREEASWHWADAASLQVRIEELPFSGSLLAVGAIGSETYAAAVGEPPPVLRTGRVIVMEKRLLSDLRYPVMEMDLQLGDEVRVMDDEGHPADTACVFSVAELDVPGIKVACHATGKTLQVSRFGGHIVEMEPGPWDMILTEPTLQAMVPLLFSVIYVLMQGLLVFIFPRDIISPHTTRRPQIKSNT